MDPDELFENAKALSKRTAEYQDILPPDIPVSKQCSEEAWGKLLDECEVQFNKLQQLQSDIEAIESDSYEHLPNETENRMFALTSELKQWLEIEPNVLSTNPEVLLAVGKEELSRMTGQLEMVLSCSQAKRDRLKESLQSEQKWLQEKKEVLKAANEQVTALQQENERLSEASILQDMKKKIQKVKDFQDSLLERLSDLLADHFPLPRMDRNAKKKNTPCEPCTELVSLHDILELLMNKAVETPHEPYVTVNDAFWPPYVETLLRYGIASRHPEDCFRIRLETFI